MQKILFMIMLLFSNLLIAEEDSTCEPTEKKTHIYFGNGIQNTFLEAMANRNALYYAYFVEDDIRVKYPNQKFKFGIAYNYSESFWADILEVFNQKKNENKISLLPLYQCQALMKLSKRDSIKLVSYFYNVDENSSEDILEETSSIYHNTIEENYHLFTQYNQEETEIDHIQKYISDLNEGRRVVIIAHSQGNLFANFNVNEVINNHPNSEDSIGILGVATPASKTIGNNEYITATDDMIINGLRTIYPVLASNINNDPSIWFWEDHRDWNNHGFMASYLASKLLPSYQSGENTLKSREKINGMLFKLLNDLTFPDVNDTSNIDNCSGGQVVVGIDLTNIDPNRKVYMDLVKITEVDLENMENSTAGGVIKTVEVDTSSSQFIHEFTNVDFGLYSVIIYSEDKSIIYDMQQMEVTNIPVNLTSIVDMNYYPPINDKFDQEGDVVGEWNITKVSDTSSYGAFSVRFNQDGSITEITEGEAGFSGDNIWNINSDGELVTTWYLYGTPVTIYSHKIIGTENGCYIVNATMQLGAWNQNYKMCKL